MFSTLKSAALSAMIGLGAIAAMPAAAQADSLYLNFGGHHGAGVGVHIGSDRAHYRYRHRPVRVCTPYRAVNKAERLGLRRAHVVNVNRRTIKVAGRQHRDRVTVTFARSGNCPIVRW